MTERAQYTLHGKYELVDEIASGSGGNRIWRGRDSNSQPILVKIIPKPLTASERSRVRGYFEDEVECGRQLEGRHIRRFIDAGELDLLPEMGYPSGVLYLVFEWITFGSLRTLLDSRTPSYDEVRDLVKAVTAGLSLAHEHTPPVVHRDLKPENILLPGGRCSQAKVADFGIARQEGGTSLTTTGLFVGTARYMAPEQFRESGTVDLRADVYSLALIVWECLVGKVPYDMHDTALTMEARLAGAAPGAIVINGQARAETTRVLISALSVDPANRPSTSVDFAEMLEEAGTTDGLWEGGGSCATGPTLADKLRASGLEVLDKRPAGGALWVIGDRSLEPALADLGVPFHFAEKGGRATENRPAWWTDSGGLPAQPRRESDGSVSVFNERGLYFLAVGRSGERRYRTLEKAHTVGELSRSVPAAIRARLQKFYPSGDGVYVWGATEGANRIQWMKVSNNDYVVSVRSQEDLWVFRYCFSYFGPDRRLQRSLGWEEDDESGSRKLFAHVYFLRDRERPKGRSKRYFQRAFGIENPRWLTGPRWFSVEEVTSAMGFAGMPTIEQFLGID